MQGCIEDLFGENVKGHCFSDNNKAVDNNSLELLFLYADDFKLFDNLKLNLNAKYLFDYDADKNQLSVTENSEYVDLFGEDINLKILCGQNGTGKSTIIDIIRNIDREDYKNCFIVLKDKNNKFITTKKNLKIKFCACDKNYLCKHPMASDFCIANLSMSKEKQENVVFHTERKLIHNYMMHPQLYDIWNNKFLFDSFEVRFWAFEDNVKQILKTLVESVKISADYIDLIPIKKYFELNPVQYIVFANAAGRLCDDYRCELAVPKNPLEFDVVKYIEKIFFKFWGNGSLEKEQYRDFNLEYLMYMYNSNYFIPQPILKDIQHIIGKYPHIQYALNKSEYNSVADEVEELTKELIEILNYKTFGYMDLFLIDHMMIETFYFKPFKDIGNNRVYFEDLSEGEQAKLKIITDLITMVYDKNGLEQTILLNDEIDAHSHPLWTKDYLFEYINAIKQNKRFLTKNSKVRKSKKLNIIITTHSPFILSDVTNDYIEYLQKEDYIGKLRDKSSINNTFAGNILQMFADNFFLDSTMGRYSRQILVEIINYLENKNLNKTILLHPNLSKSEKDTICRKVINSVGDSILHRMLCEKYERHLSNGKN